MQPQISMWKAQYPHHFVCSVNIDCFLLIFKSAFGGLSQQQLILGQSQSSGILPLCTLCLRTNSIIVCSVFCKFFPMCQELSFCFLMIWLGIIVLLSWGSVGSVYEQSPRTSFLRGLFSRFISMQVMALLWKIWELLAFRWLQNLTSLFWILIIGG